MKFDTCNDRDILVVDIDGRKSDPIIPLSPEMLERIKRMRDAYVKSGLSEKQGVLVIDVDGKNSDPISSVSVELLESPRMKESQDAANGCDAERKPDTKNKPESEAK